MAPLLENDPDLGQLVLGMGRLFNDLASAVAGGTKGGPAKVGVIASGLLGMINGAAVAVVVTIATEHSIEQEDDAQDGKGRTADAAGGPPPPKGQQGVLFPVHRISSGYRVRHGLYPEPEAPRHPCGADPNPQLRALSRMGEGVPESAKLKQPPLGHDFACDKAVVG